MTSRGPVYFISHGGPPSMFDTAGGPYQAWKRVGQRIGQDVSDGKINKSKGLVCVSAHWESEDSSGKRIELNTNLSNPLIYDFYGFPKHFYAQTFQSSFSDEHVSDVEKQLSNAGWTVDRTDRGLDHGLWVPFKVAFRQEAQNTQTPSPPTADVIANTPSIIQLSLPGNSDEHTTLKLGQTLSGLRDQGYAIVATGQAVHNLRDLRSSRALGGSGQTTYGSPFLQSFLSAATSPRNELAKKSTDLFKHSEYRKAHPTPEHLLPLIVASGAVQGDSSQPVGEVIYQEDDGPLGWAMIRWD